MSMRTAVLVTSALAIAGAVHAATNRRHLPHLRPESAPAGPSSRVSVLIPARDEAATIDDCLASVRAQRGVADLEILVLDDRSGDATAARITEHARSDPRVHLLAGAGEPPAGWLGKPYACHQLALAATGAVLVFVDADVRLHPHAVATAVDQLGRSGADLLSAWPRQLATTPLAWLVQPLQQWSWLTTTPLHRATDRPSLAVANGQFLVLTRAGYVRCGGHAAVAGEVLEDIALARQVRRSGGRSMVADASAVARCLMYADDAAVVEGYTKSLWRAFGGPARGVAVTTALAAVYLIPPTYAAIGRDPTLRSVAGLGYAAAVVNRVIAARATGGPVLSAPTHPLAMVALWSLTAVSGFRRRRGTLRWRGRAVATQ